MTQGEFIDKVNELKPILWGQGQRIAEKAGVSYSLYQQYCKGVAPIEETRIKIYNAMIEKVAEIRDLSDAVKIE